MWKRALPIGNFELDFLFEAMTEVVIQGGGMQSVFGQRALAVSGQLNHIFFSVFGRYFYRRDMAVRFFEFDDDGQVGFGAGE